MSDCNENGTEDTAAATGRAASARPAESGSGTSAVGTHTPGPWRASMQVSRENKPLGWIIEHNNDRIGWSSFASARTNQGEGPPYSIGGANARLICAAPDLLAALRIVRAGAEFDDAIGKIIDEAIAKATSGSPT